MSVVPLCVAPYGLPVPLHNWPRAHPQTVHGWTFGHVQAALPGCTLSRLLVLHYSLGALAGHSIRAQLYPSVRRIHVGHLAIGTLSTQASVKSSTPRTKTCVGLERRHLE